MKATGPRVSRQAILAMVALCTAVFVAALDQTMVLTVMPSIMRSFYISVRDLNDAGWIITGYLLGYTVAMPLFGRLADVRGRRPMALLALVIFLVGISLPALIISALNTASADNTQQQDTTFEAAVASSTNDVGGEVLTLADARTMGGEHHELEPVRHLVNAIFDRHAGHAVTPWRGQG